MTQREINAQGHPGRVTTGQVLAALAGRRQFSSIEIAEQLGKKRAIITERFRELEREGRIVCLRKPQIGRHGLPGLWKLV